MMGCGNSKSRRLKDNRQYKVRTEQETTTTDLVAEKEDFNEAGSYKTSEKQNNSENKDTDTAIQIEITHTGNKGGARK